MLSIIIASANPDLLTQVKQNVAATIGVPYEVLAFDNRGAKRGICEIYNEGIDNSQYDLLCFMHEDISFETQDWGRVVVDIFNNTENIGVLGVAGSTYKSLTPSGWLPYTSIETERSHIIQAFKYQNRPPIHQYKNPDNEKLASVGCADGVWLCVKKQIAASVRFDEKTFPKFHCYDLDFSLSVGQRHQNFVTFDVLLQHFSEGNFNGEWMSEILRFHDKWRRQLPYSVKPYTKKQVYRIEKQNFKFFLKQLLDFKLPATEALRFVWKNSTWLRKNQPQLFAKFHYYIFKWSVLKLEHPDNRPVAP